MRLGSIVRVKRGPHKDKTGKVKAICHGDAWEYLVDFNYQNKESSIHAGIWISRTILEEIGHESF